MKTFGLMLAGASLLAGCSGGGEPADGNRAANESNIAAAPSAPPGNTTNGTADAARANCATAPSSGTGADVLGARLGMTPEEVFAVLNCANPAFATEYRTDNIAQMPPMPDGSLPRTAVMAAAGDDVATVYVMGPTGRERAIVLMHDIAFPQDQAPSVEALVASLQGKYGPAQTIAGSGSAVVRSIANAPGGAAFRTDSPDFRRCTQALGWNSDSQFVTQGGCGLTINYRIDRRADDPARAQKLYVIVADQAAAIRATEQARRDIPTLTGRAAAPGAAAPGGPVPQL